MKTKLGIFCLLLVNTLGAPASNEDDVLRVTEEFFNDQLAVYTAQYDVVSIIVPLNGLNFENDDSKSTENTDSNAVLFFVEADINDGVKDYKGLYMLKNRNAVKLLEQGTDAATVSDDTKLAYFSAKDGIYIYNGVTNLTEKYGTVSDSLIGIAKVKGSDVIYVLSKDHVVYKVTEEGTKKEKVEGVDRAQQIVLDYNNNLYFYGPDHKPYVMGGDGKKEITGLPENPASVKLIRPPFIIEDGVPFLVNDRLYVIYANGSSEIKDLELQVKPTAYSTEATLLQYYAYKKKIYEYNLVVLAFTDLENELKEYLEQKNDTIQLLATRSRSDMRTRIYTN